MIHRLHHMIGSAQDSQSHPTMGYVRAVPCPFYGGLFDRLRDAREVIVGRAFAVRWPKGGELEAALVEGVPYRGRPPMPIGPLQPGREP